MRDTQSLVRPSCSPKLPSVPKTRFSSGLSDLVISSTFLWVTPSSSALIMANNTHFTVSDHRAKWLLRDDLRKHNVIGRVGELQTVGVKTRCVGCEGITAPGFIR